MFSACWLCSRKPGVGFSSEVSRPFASVFQNVCLHVFSRTFPGFVMQLNFIEKLPIIKFSFRIELTLGHLVFLTNSWKLWSQVSTGNISSRTNWCTCCFVFKYTSLNRNLNNTVGCFSMCSNTASNQMAAFEMWPRPPKRISEWSKYKSALHKHEFGRLLLNVQIYNFIKFWKNPDVTFRGVGNSVQDLNIIEMIKKGEL